MAEIFALFAFSAWTFWAFSVPVFLILCVLLESKSYWWTSLIFIAFLALTSLGNDLWDWTLEHPWLTVARIGGYVAFGAFVWAPAKWYFYAHKILRKYKVALEEFIDIHKIKNRDWTDDEKRDFKSSYTLRYLGSEIPPHPKNHKADIVNWVAYWPISFVATMIDEPLVKLARFIYDRILAGMFVRISSAVFKDVQLP